jgi:hypothetical protein
MSRNSNEAHDLTRTVVRLHTAVLAFACAVIGGAVVFAMTVWLVIKGGPQVGAHLQLLSQYFYGYAVTWKGSFVGFLYGAVTGGVVGWVIGAVYNGVAGLRR